MNPHSPIIPSLSFDIPDPPHLSFQSASPARRGQLADEPESRAWIPAFAGMTESIIPAVPLVMPDPSHLSFPSSTPRLRLEERKRESSLLSSGSSSQARG